MHVPAILELDVSDLATVPQKCKQAIEIYGKIDILINNAGIGIRGTVLETELDVHQQIMGVNYFGALAMTKGN